MINKFFSSKSIGLATYFGGPFAGGILIAINLKRDEEISKALWTLIFSLLATTILFGILIQIPEEIIDKIPSALIPTVYTPVVVLASKYLQSGNVEEALKERENREHWWKSLVIGLVGTVITLVIIVTISLNQPLFPGQKVTYGAIQNEIYISENVEKKIADSMYRRLSDLGYFHDEFPQYAYLEMNEDNCKIVIYIDRSFWEHTEVVSSLTAFKWGMETETGKEVMLYLRYADISGEKDKLLE